MSCHDCPGASPGRWVAGFSVAHPHAPPETAAFTAAASDADRIRPAWAISESANTRIGETRMRIRSTDMASSKRSYLLHNLYCVRALLAANVRIMTMIVGNIPKKLVMLDKTNTVGGI